ncbi:MAG: serine protease, partial [Nevskia sp.]|nr:serine protease [Nevskia sp.]
MRAQTARLILVTVANVPEPMQTHAGSSLHGYEAMPLYAKSGSARARLDAIAADYQLRPMAEWPIQSLAVQCVVFELAADQDRDATLERLSKDARVALAQPMQTFGTLSAGYNDPYVGLQRGFAQIDAADAQQWSRGDGIRVAVIDTGMDSVHADLQGRVESHRNFVDDDARQFYADRHGTEVAGVIAADANNHEGIVGVAPGVRILAFKACWQLEAHADSALCNSFTLAQ